MQVLLGTFAKWVEIFSLKVNPFMHTIFMYTIFLETLVNVTPIKIQGHHGRFLAGKAITIFYFSKSSQGLGGLASRGGPEI